MTFDRLWLKLFDKLKATHLVNESGFKASITNWVDSKVSLKVKKI